MSTSSLLQRLKLRHKIAALGVVGMALCLLPLIQLLRYQGLELQWAHAAQAQLEPAVIAVELQRGLVDHRASAALWLQGRREVDALRRQQQAVVDARLALLDQGVEVSGLVGAQAEVEAMRTDWPTLVQQVVGSGLSVGASDGAHRLLVEQALQVIDIVTAAAAPGPDGASFRQAAAAARVQWQAGTTTWPMALATLSAAQTQLRAVQARRIEAFEARRNLAAAALLALAAGIVGLLLWLRAALLRVPAVPPDHTGPDPATDPTAARRPQAAARQPGWLPPPPDGQHSPRDAGHGLLQRLRRPAPAAPRLDQPTEPQEP